MGGKKKGKKKGKGKKGIDLMNDPDDFKSFNVAQRQTIADLMERMNRLREENVQLRTTHKDQLESQIVTTKNDVSKCKIVTVILAA